MFPVTVSYQDFCRVTGVAITVVLSHLDLQLTHISPF